MGRERESVIGGGREKTRKKKIKGMIANIFRLGEESDFNLTW